MDAALYAPEDVKVNILGFDVEGYSRQSFLKISSQAPDVKEKKSIYGNVKLIKTAQTTRTIEITLDRTASSNSWLHLLMTVQKRSGYKFPIPVFIQDKNGLTKLFCANSYFEVEPEVELSQENTNTRWILKCPSSSLTIGGNVMGDKTSAIISSLMTVIQLSSLFDIDLSDFTGTIKQIASVAGSSLGGLLNV